MSIMRSFVVGAVNKIIESGHGQVRLHVAEWNEAAVKMYLKEGFEIVNKEEKTAAKTADDIYEIEKISGLSLDIYKIYEQYKAAMYLVCGREKACLIDTAYGLKDLSKITASLTSLPVFVVNTHGHVDHVLGNHYFDKAFIHPSDKYLYREKADGYADILNMPWVRKQYGDYLKDIDPSKVRFPDAEDINDGDVIDLGGKKLEIIEIPGHTPGSILLIDRDEKICFSGDSIIEHPWLFLEESLSEDAYFQSLKRAVKILKEYGIERIYSGHYAYKPLTLSDADHMTDSMEIVCKGKAGGHPFKNYGGTGIEYSFGEWSVLCKDHDAQVRH